MPAPLNATGKRPMGKVQMQAQGDVRIAGQVPSKASSACRPSRASYDKQRTLSFSKATRVRQPNSGGVMRPASIQPPTEARKIRYVRSTGE